MLDSGVIVARSPRPARRRLRRRRLLRRAVPIGGVAIVAFAAGAVIATQPGDAERQTVTNYVSAWEHRDFARMYSLLDSSSRRRVSEAAFVDQVQGDAALATVTSLKPKRVGGLNGQTIAVRMLVHTKLWCLLHETLEVPVTGSGSAARIHLSDSLLFPGLRGGEHLHRRTTLPPRGTLLASDGTPLAQGPDRSSPIPDVAQQIVGTLGPIPGDAVSGYTAEGYPRNAKVGHDGLERIFEKKLAGTPGGRLLAGHRPLANVASVPGASVTTTISPSLERAAVTAMGGQYAGIAVMNPRTGGLLALAGIAFSAVQPPGSTMKIVTTAGALQAGITTLGTSYPIATEATIDGFALQNAGGEACGGTLLNAFAVSCNSVFAPLGAKLGAARLLSIANRFGFNEPSSIPGAAESTMPAASLNSDLAVGSSAIGQGLVQTTPLEMTDVAATIAMGGRRPIPTLLAHQPPRFVRVISGHVAREVQQAMVAVVESGTGTSAQISGVTVAGKTGTAELRDTSAPGASTAQNTDAWFVGYAPVPHTRVVAGALFPNQGYGGAAAAPPVRDVLAAALGQ